MRILVTGATGLLGSSICPYLKERGFDVVRHGHSGSADVTGDLCDRAAAEAVVATIEADVVLNLVALTNVDRCEEAPHQAYLLNVRSVENLAQALARRPAFLVHVSTDQLYDGEGPHREEAVHISNTYAFSKYAGELAAARVPSTVLRTNFFGFSGKPGRPSFSDWLLTEMRAGHRLNVFTDVKFSPLSLPTLNRMLRITLEQQRPGVYNLGSRHGFSKADFAFALAQAFGLDTQQLTRTTCDVAALKAYRPRDMRLDVERFAADFAVELPDLRDEIDTLKEASHAQAE